MRPLRLHVKGFTAFRDPAQIDFRELDLFSLWGPTGSGKSSILDAITYALYGKVERVEHVRGETVTSLITHGQPGMAVTLDFEVGDQALRVTRRTSSAGQSKIRLDRLEGDDWVSFGEGADSVSQVNKIIPEVVGLDYDAFTRSVVLPQGKFAEFLSGDAKKRRDILTELLGLEMFGRMAKHANDIARDAKAALTANQKILETEYHGIDPDAVKRAREVATRLTDQAQTASQAEELLEDLHQDFEEQSRKAEDLVDVSSEVDKLIAAFERHASALARHGEDMKAASGAAREAREAVEKAREEHARIARERGEAEDASGALDELSGLRAEIVSFQNLEKEAAKATDTVGRQRKAETAAQKALETKDREVRKADEAVAEAQATVEKRRDEQDHARRHDLVGALTHGLKKGDDCPVCERPLTNVPAVDASALSVAEENLALAEVAAKKAQEVASAAHVDRAKAAQAVEEARNRVGECSTVAEEKAESVAEARAALTKRLPGIDDDPMAEVERRMQRLRDLAGKEKNAADALAAATDASQLRQEALSSLTTEVAAIRGAVESAPVNDTVTRAEAVSGRRFKMKLPAKLPAGASELAGVAEQTGKDLEQLRADLADAGEELLEKQAALLTKARDALPEEWADDIEGSDVKQLLAGARKLCRDLSRRAALAEKEASTIEEKLAKRAIIEQELADHKREHEVYNALHRELKSDRIVQFLQAEALEVLAATAGEHLKELSEGRYRLSFEDDRYYVIDGWNGDEKRSVRTLSGGETFLASLALALALSEQVQLLAVTERARLQSLFLDEGFGSLDAETLDVVVSAINRLGNDGRLVGLITHVPELAEAMPVRIEVIKGPRGSTIKPVDGAIPEGAVPEGV